MILRNIKNKFTKQQRIKSLFLIDILSMKDLNAIYSFKNGDFILKQVNTLFKKTLISKIKQELCINKEIQFINKSADIFELHIYHDLEMSEILKIKELIYSKIINTKFKLLEENQFINIDITIACAKSLDYEMIRIYAEKALHSAKINFVNFTYCDAKLYENGKISKDLIQTLHYNIENKLVEPHFQAIMCNKTENIVKYEALMRLFDKDGNIIMPAVFIEKAKKARVYSQLLEIFMNKIISYIIKHNIHVSINLNYTDLLNPNLKKNLIEKIKKNNIGKFLTIEILESERIINFTIINEFIMDLKKYDVKVAIDDFGTGFSNYEYILSLNVDYIKIDGSLVKKVDDEMYKNLIKSIVAFCKEQEIKVVAEFVSSLKILRYVKSIGVDYSQGYFISKPIDLDTLLGEKSEE